MSNKSGQFTPTERAIKHEYDIRTERWSRREIQVVLAMAPFQEGTNRTAFYMKDLSFPLNQQDFVAKLAKNPMEERQTYFSEVEMQCKCKALAEEYNHLNPPKRIDFVQPCVLELLQRVGPNGKSVLMGVEPYLKGVYRKYSNNYGFVSEDDRNTPHAFSHFTYQQSGGNILVCDIQGVEGENTAALDIYTDPQIHSNLGANVYKYGNGDMGIDGIRHFFATHRCNHICRMMGLTPNPVISAPLCSRPDFNLKIGLGRGTSECSRASSIGGLSGCSSACSEFMPIRPAVYPRSVGFQPAPYPQLNLQPLPAFPSTPMGISFPGFLGQMNYPSLLIHV